MTEEGYHEGVLTVRRAAAAALCGEGSLTMSRASAFAFHEQCTLSRLSPRTTLQALQAVMQALGQGDPNTADA